MALTETKIKVWKVADYFTDTWNEQITDLLVDFGLKPTDENVEKVIKEVIKIYTNDYKRK